MHGFVAYMADKYGFEAGKLEATFARVSRSDKIIELMSKPAEKVKPWYEYRAVFITDKRIRDGAAFCRNNEAALARAAKTYGVTKVIKFFEYVD